MLDMYDFENDIWLCHSFGGTCLNITSFVSDFIDSANLLEFVSVSGVEVVQDYGICCFVSNRQVRPLKRFKCFWKQIRRRLLPFSLRIM